MRTPVAVRTCVIGVLRKSWRTGAQEIAARLGVSRQRVQLLVIRADSAALYDEMAMGKVWLIEDIEA
jgi:hypothetical protein